MSKNVEGKTILYLGNKLKSKGFNPTTIDLLSDALKQEGLQLLTYSSKKNKVLRLIDMVMAIIKHRHQTDYALIDTYSTSAFWFAYISAKLLSHFKIPYVPILHGGNLPERYTTHQKKVMWLLNYAKTNVSPSDYLFEFFSNKGITNLNKISNFIPIDKYRFKERAHLKPHLLWVRAFDNIYNPLLALQVLELLLVDYPEATLSMVGPTKDDSYKVCKSYAVQKQLPVSFTGKLSKEEWICYAQDFDIFLNTTSVDNMPISVIEAMALGMLVVSTNVGGIPYILNNNENALLVKPNNKDEMASAVTHLIQNEELSKNIARKGRKKAEEYSWHVVKQKWVDVLK